MARDNIQAHFRLDQQAYEALEKQVLPVVVQRDTTDIQAGYMLGIQQVLGLLRKGFVIGSGA